MTPPAALPEDIGARLARIEQLIESQSSRMDERRGQYLEKIEDAKISCERQGVRVTELEKGLARNDEATGRIGSQVTSMEARFRDLERKVESLEKTVIRVSVIAGLGTGALTAGITATVMKMMGG
jgi:predicted nuclease with TOPRIM domain